jgi:hypothetical protein
VIDEHAPADRRAGMDFYAGEKPCDLRNETREPTRLRVPARMREPM